MKYLIYACLLLGCFAILFFIFKTVSSTQQTERNTYVVLDYPDTNMIQTEMVLSKGKLLFQQNCQSCHPLDRRADPQLLKGFSQRGPWTNRENVYEWLRNPAAFMKKNVYAKGLKEEYGVMMLAFPTLKNEDIDAIIDYINMADHS